MKTLSIAAALASLVAALAVADEEPEPLGTHAVGLYINAVTPSPLGPVTGGISYRSWTPRVGFQVLTSLYMNPGDHEGFRYYSFYYQLSVEGDVVLISGNITPWLYSQVYLFGGVTHLGEDTYAETWDEVAGEAVFGGEPWVPRVRLALGTGAELVLFSLYSLSGGVGFAVTWSPTFVELLDQLHLGVYLQWGFQYRF